MSLGSSIMPFVNGIACAGNWIVDHIKIIDCWPEQGALSNIRSSEHGVGGSAANVLTDLQSLGFPAPTLALRTDTALTRRSLALWHGGRARAAM